MRPDIEEKETTENLTFRPPGIEDGAAVHNLIDRCKPLDLNSTYAYLMLCAYFARTCVVVAARMDGGQEEEAAGFISGFIPPEKPDTLFVWQVAVDGRMRGRRLARRMLFEILGRDACRDVRFMETTVTPSNEPSMRLFRGFARAVEAECREEVLFESEHFGASGHEAEHLLRIGPFAQDKPSHHGGETT